MPESVGGGDDFVAALAPPRKPMAAKTTSVATADDGFIPEPGRKPPVPPSQAKAQALAQGQSQSARAPTIAEFTESARSAARIANVSFADVMAKAAQESNFNVNSRTSSSSAAGPFQFIEQTWLDMLKRHGAAYGLGKEVAQIKTHNGVASVADPALRKQLLDLRKDVSLSSGMAARYLDESGKDLARALHRKPTETESRMAYFLGPGGAAKLIRAAQSNPDGPSDAVLPQAAAANRSLFYGANGALSNRQAVTKITQFVSRHLKDFAALGKEERPVTTDRVVSPDPNVG
ncbi:MAG: lytic transglycosylase domain-containing protein [Rhodospirillaceae bacterium]